MSAPGHPARARTPHAWRCRRSAAAGFTLVELLVALLITAIMFVIGYSELDQALKSRRELDEQTARLIAIQQAMRIIEQDFELLQPRPVRNLVGDGYLPAITTDSTSAVGTVQLSAGSSSSAGVSIPIVTFTRGSWTNPAGLQRSELQRVSYAISNGALIREYSPVLDATLDDTVVTRTLLDHVQGFRVRFMDAGHNWQTQWPASSPATDASTTTTAGSAQDPTLRFRPVAIEVTLLLQDWGLVVREIEVAG
jgi:general secretion pathway protein J